MGRTAMSGLEDGAEFQPATLHMRTMEEPETVHDKRLLVADGGASRPVWLVRGHQVSKIAVLSAVITVLAVLCLLLAVVCATLTASGGSPAPPSECRSTGCLRLAADITSYLNRSVAPCEDFYQFACGRFDDVHPLGIQISYGIQEVLEHRNQIRIEELLERSQFHNNRSAISKVRTFYRTCMDAVHLNSSSAQLRDLINDISGLDMLGTFDPDTFQFLEVFLRTREEHRLRLFFSLTWLQTLGRIMVSLPLLGMKSRTVYTTDSDQARAARAAYRDSIVTILQRLQSDLPDADTVNRTCSTCAEDMADAVLHVETELVRAMPESSHILPAPANVMTLETLTRIAPLFQWRRLLDVMFGAGAVVDSASVQVPSREYMVNLNALIESSNASLINNYIQWSLIRQYLPAAGPLYSVLAQELELVTRQAATQPRQAVCFDLVRQYFPHALRSLFVRGHIGVQNVAAARHVVGRVKKQLAASFGWMTPHARTQSLAVLKNMRVTYGHSPWVADPRRLDDYYSSVHVTTDNFLTNMLNADHFKARELRANAARLADDDDYDDDDWIEGDTADVRVVYNPVRDRLRVPAGGLQVPLFDHESPSYINVATLGSLVLAELAGPFFLRHRTYRLPSWWDTETTAKYRQYAVCLMNSLKGYTIDVKRGFHYLSSNGSSGAHRKSEVPLDPRNSANYVQAEHLAFQMSHRIFKQILADDGLQHVLPGTQSRTPEQLFFLAYAQSRCRNTNPYLRVLLNSAFKKFPHPEMINNFVYNSPSFIEAYQCSSIPVKHKGRHCTLE